MRSILVWCLPWLFLVSEAQALSLGNQSQEASPRSELDGLFENPTWARFEQRMREQKQQEQQEGLAMMISGGIAFVGGIVGYHNTQDVFAKGAYALAQSLGVAAVGYGAMEQRLGSQHHLLHETLLQHPSLSERERDQMVRIYFRLQADRQQETNKVAALTHGLLAGLNLYNASISSHEDLRSALYFVAAINLLAVLSYTF